MVTAATATTATRRMFSEIPARCSNPRNAASSPVMMSDLRESARDTVARPGPRASGQKSGQVR